MNEFRTFRQRMAHWNFSDITRVIVIVYLMALASAITNRSTTDVTVFVSNHLHVEIGVQVFLFNLCFMGAVATYALVDRTWVLMFWLAWPLIFNVMAVWQIITAAPISTETVIGLSNHNAVNGAFIFIFLTALIVVTEVFEQRQSALLKRVINVEKDCSDRVAAAVADRRITE